MNNKMIPLILTNNVLLKSILLLCFFMLYSNKEALALDSTKVFVAGWFFKGETYYIHVNNQVYKIKCKWGSDAFSFYVLHSDSIKDGEFMKLTIWRKGRWGLRYFDTNTVIMYDDSRKYLVLSRSNRVKNRYSFEVEWLNNHPSSLGYPRFWDTEDISFDKRLVNIKDLEKK